MVFTVLPYQDPWEEYEEYRSILTVLLREYLLWRQSPIHLSEPGEWSLSSLMQRLNGEDVRRFTLSKEGERQYHQMMGQLLEREGGQRPDCVEQHRWVHPRRNQTFYWNDDRDRAAQGMVKVIEKLEREGQREAAKLLRIQLDHILPAPWEDERTAQEKSATP